MITAQQADDSVVGSEEVTKVKAPVLSSRYEEAALAWRRLLELRGCPAPLVREATEALAIHHEHRVRDLGAARSFALQSLDYPGTASHRDAVNHRLARLDRKIDAAFQNAALF